MGLGELQFPKVEGGKKERSNHVVRAFNKWYKIYTVLEFCRTRCARERDDIPDILHSCYEEYQTLKAKAETGVRA